MKVFASGSCRLVTTINHGYSLIIPIHSMIENFRGINFLGKLHNTKQHLQFINWLLDKIELPSSILSAFLTSYGKYNNSDKNIESRELNPEKKSNIKSQFDLCDAYIFEICSLKLYEKDGHQVQYELTNDYITQLQSEEDLYTDLTTIRNILPSNKKLIFQTHFRPNIIYNDVSRVIEKRESIYNIVDLFCKNNENTYHYDPSIIIKEDHSLFDGDTHLSPAGHSKSFDFIYKTYLSGDI